MVDFVGILVDTDLVEAMDEAVVGKTLLVLDDEDAICRIN